MKRFYFNVEKDQLEVDRPGTELADVNGARSAALVLLGEMIRDAYCHSV
jgi:Domain of unknown function (DUF6894)